MSSEILTTFTKHQFSGSNGVNLPYRLFNSETEQLKPLVLFLHGSGERGMDNELPLTANDSVPTIYEYARDVEDAVILVPQAPMADLIGAWVFDDVAESLMELIDEVVQSYPIDENRIYITGLSNGGAGVLNLLVQKPGRFAGAVCICGYIHGEANDIRVLPREITTSEAKKIGTTPIWLFHAEDDDVVLVENSQQVVAALHDFGNDHVRYTEYPTGTVQYPHCSWDNAFDNQELLPWLFSQKLN